MSNILSLDHEEDHLGNFGSVVGDTLQRFMARKIVVGSSIMKARSSCWIRMLRSSTQLSSLQTLIARAVPAGIAAGSFTVEAILAKGR